MRTRSAPVHRWLCPLALWLVLLGRAGAAPAKRAIVISWDGAANWVVDRLLAEGRLPNVARLARMGVRMDYSTPAYPSKTFPGHAALWTGANGDVNGISDNDSPLFPRAEHTLREAQFAGKLQAEALWLTAARAGKKVATLSMPFAGPPDQRLTPLQGAGIPADRFVSAGSFGTAIAPDMIHDGKDLLPATGWTGLPPHRGPLKEQEFTVGDTRFYALVYDDPASPATGANTVLIRQESKEADRATATATLKPVEAEANIRHFSPRFRVTKGDVFGYT